MGARMAHELRKEKEKKNGKAKRNMEWYLCEFVAAKNITI